MYSTEKLNTILQEYGGFLGGIVSIWLVIANEEESLDIVFKDKAWCAKFHGEHILAKGYTGNEDFYAKRGQKPKHGSEIAIVTFKDGTIFRFPCYELAEGEQYPNCNEEVLFRMEAERTYGKERFAAMLGKVHENFGKPSQTATATLITKRGIRDGNGREEHNG